MLTNSRFKRVARDLEKLPCELHEPVLADLEFEQLIRLSQAAGPLLVWSLEHSPSHWAQFFRNGSATEWQKFLACTDRVKVLCFGPTKEKGQPFIFESGPLSFLHHRSSDWASQRSWKYDNTILNRVSLHRYWCDQIHSVIISMTWMEFRREDSGVLEPWISHLESVRTTLTAQGTFSLREIFDRIAFCNRSRYFVHNPRGLSLDELIAFIDSYQRIRRIRADALAGELYRLADLYEAHPTRLKTPFAPQTRRRNEKHVPQDMRCEARNLVKKAKYKHWNDKRPYQTSFKFPFPALIPYDWCMQLFVKVLQKYILSESVYPKDVLEKCKFVLRGVPPWVSTEVEKAPAHADTIDDTSHAFKLLDLDSGTPVHMRILTESSDDRKYLPHTDAELVWLETFMQAVAWMEVRFPDLVQEVRGHEWYENNGHQNRWVKRKLWIKSRKASDALKNPL